MMDLNRLAAQPPSDFVGDGGGGDSKKKWKVVAGVGCGLALLVALAVGVAVAYGGVKCASCAGQVMDMAKNVMAVYQTAGALTAHASQGDWAAVQEMWAEGGPQAQEIGAALGPYRQELQQGSCGVIFQAQSVGLGPQGSWPVKLGASVEEMTEGVIAVAYSQGTGEEDLVMRLKLHNLNMEEEGAAPEYVIEGLALGKRPYEMERDMAVNALQQLHKQLEAGQLYGVLWQGFFQSMTDRFPDADALKRFFEEEEPLLAQGVMNVRRVDHLAAGKAVIDVQFLAGDQERHARFVMQQASPCVDRWGVVGLETAAMPFGGGGDGGAAVVPAAAPGEQEAAPSEEGKQDGQEEGEEGAAAGEEQP